MSWPIAYARRTAETGQGTAAIARAGRHRSQAGKPGLITLRALLYSRPNHPAYPGAAVSWMIAIPGVRHRPWQRACY